MRLLTQLILSALFILCLASAARAADDEIADVEVHEWSVWIVDSTLERANELAHFPNALPAVVQSERARSANQGKLSPLSLVTFHGEPQKDFEVELRIGAGRFVSHWPAGSRSGERLRWIEAALTSELPPAARMAHVDAAHWFQQAREVDSLYLSVGGRSERFLAYDPELRLSTPIQLAGGPDQYQITSTATFALGDTLVIAPTPEGPRLGWIDELQQGAQTPTEIIMSAPVTADTPGSAAARADLAARLEKSGLHPDEAELLLSMYAAPLLRTEQLLVVIRLPSAALEQLVPLITYPSVKKTVRTGLLVVRNIDPALKDQVGGLIAQLGAESYKEREAAEQRLTTLGRLGIPALKQALASTDIEVVYRAERILLKLKESIDPPAAATPATAAPVALPATPAK